MVFMYVNTPVPWILWVSHEIIRIPETEPIRVSWFMNLRIFRPLRIEDGILDGRNVPSPIDPGESYRIIGFIGEIPKILGHLENSLRD